MLVQPEFGRRVRELRLDRGMSQAALASGAMSTGYLSRIESGARPPTPKVVAHLAHQFGVSQAHLETAASSSLAQVMAAVTSAIPETAGAVQLGAEEAGSTAGSPGHRAAAVVTALREAGDRWDPPLRWQALWYLSGLPAKSAEDRQAVLAELGQLADSLGVPVLQARSATRRARRARIDGDYALARQHAAAGCDAAADLGVPDRAAALQELVSAETEAGLLGEAEERVARLCELTCPAGGPPYVNALWSAATVRVRRSDYAGAEEMLAHLLEVVDGRQDPTLWMRVHLGAASLYLQVDPPRPQRARECVRRVTPVLEILGLALHRQQLLSVRAHLAFEEGSLEEARRLEAQLDGQPLLLSFRDRVRFRALSYRLQILDGQTADGIRGLQELAEGARAAAAHDLAAEIWRCLAGALAFTTGSGTPR